MQSPALPDEGSARQDERDGPMTIETVSPPPPEQQRREVGDHTEDGVEGFIQEDIDGDDDDDFDADDAAVGSGEAAKSSREGSNDDIYEAQNNDSKPFKVAAATAMISEEPRPQVAPRSSVAASGGESSIDAAGEHQHQDIPDATSTDLIIASTAGHELVPSAQQQPPQEPIAATLGWLLLSIEKVEDDGPDRMGGARQQGAHQKSKTTTALGTGAPLASPVLCNKWDAAAVRASRNLPPRPAPSTDGRREFLRHLRFLIFRAGSTGGGGGAADVADLITISADDAIVLRRIADVCDVVRSAKGRVMRHSVRTDSALETVLGAWWIQLLHAEHDASDEQALLQLNATSPRVSFDVAVWALAQLWTALALVAVSARSNTTTTTIVETTELIPIWSAVRFIERWLNPPPPATTSGMSSSGKAPPPVAPISPIVLKGVTVEHFIGLAFELLDGCSDAVTTNDFLTLYETCQAVTQLCEIPEDMRFSPSAVADHNARRRTMEGNADGAGSLSKSNGELVLARSRPHTFWQFDVEVDIRDFLLSPAANDDEVLRHRQYSLMHVWITYPRPLSDAVERLLSDGHDGAGGGCHSVAAHLSVGRSMQTVVENIEIDSSPPRHSSSSSSSGGLPPVLRVRRGGSNHSHLELRRVVTSSPELASKSHTSGENSAPSMPSFAMVDPASFHPLQEDKSASGAAAQAPSFATGAKTRLEANDLDVDWGSGNSGGTAGLPTANCAAEDTTIEGPNTDLSAAPWWVLARETQRLASDTQTAATPPSKAEFAFDALKSVATRVENPFGPSAHHVLSFAVTYDPVSDAPCRDAHRVAPSYPPLRPQDNNNNGGGLDDSVIVDFVSPLSRGVAVMPWSHCECELSGQLPHREVRGMIVFVSFPAAQGDDDAMERWNQPIYERSRNEGAVAKSASEAAVDTAQIGGGKARRMLNRSLAAAASASSSSPLPPSSTSSSVVGASSSSATHRAIDDETDHLRSRSVLYTYDVFCAAAPAAEGGGDDDVCDLFRRLAAAPCDDGRHHGSACVGFVHHLGALIASAPKDGGGSGYDLGSHVSLCLSLPPKASSVLRRLVRKTSLPYIPRSAGSSSSMSFALTHNLRIPNGQEAILQFIRANSPDVVGKSRVTPLGGPVAVTGKRSHHRSDENETDERQRQRPEDMLASASRIARFTEQSLKRFPSRRTPTQLDCTKQTHLLVQQQRVVEAENVAFLYNDGAALGRRSVVSDGGGPATPTQVLLLPDSNRPAARPLSPIRTGAEIAASAERLTQPARHRTRPKQEQALHSVESIAARRKHEESSTSSSPSPTTNGQTPPVGSTGRSPPSSFSHQTMAEAEAESAVAWRRRMANQTFSRILNRGLTQPRAQLNRAGGFGSSSSSAPPVETLPEATVTATIHVARGT